MSAPDPLITRLERLGPDEWRPEPPPQLVLPREAQATPRRRRALTLRPLPAIAAALLLLAVGAGGALIATSGDEDPGRTLALAPLARGAGGDGKVEIARTGGRATLAVSGLAPSRRGEFYELWLLSPPGDLVSLGSFRVAARRPRDARGAGAGRPLPVPLRRRFGGARTTAIRRTPRGPSCEAAPELVCRAPHFGQRASMERIVVAAKAGADQPWLADAAAELAHQTGAAVSVVSLDGLDVEALSPTPRSEFTQLAETTVNGFVERLRAAGIEAEGARPRRARGPRRAALRRGEGRGRDRLRRARPRAASPAACSAACRSI